MLRTVSRCAAVMVALALVGTVSTAAADPMPPITIPPVNRAGQPRPPPRPAVGDLGLRVEQLIAALNGQQGAEPNVLFLQRQPFLAIKDMHGADGYFSTLLRWYANDVMRERAALPGGTGRWVLSRVELSSRCVWMTEGREANRLPYWSCYGSRLVLARNGQQHTVRMNVLINWGDQWFVTHLGPIPRRGQAPSR